LVNVLGLVEELGLELLEGFEGSGVLGEFAGEGVEGAFGGGAMMETEPFVLDLEGAFGTILFAGAEKEGGVTSEIGGIDFAAGDLAEGFLTQCGENGFWNLARTATNQGDEGIRFHSGAVNAISPTIMRIGDEKLVDLFSCCGRKTRILETHGDGVVIRAFAEPDKDVFLLFLRERKKGVGRDFTHNGWAKARPEGVSRHSVRRESGSTRKSM
jgi:hypothetical protein